MYFHGYRPLKSESENDASIISRLLYWACGDIDEAIKAFLDSAYYHGKDSVHKKKIDRPDYLPRVAAAVMPSVTAAQKDAKYRSEKAICN